MVESIKNIIELCQKIGLKKTFYVLTSIVIVYAIYDNYENIIKFINKKVLESNEKQSFVVKFTTNKNFTKTSLLINSKQCVVEGNNNKFFSCDYLPPNNYSYTFNGDGILYNGNLTIADVKKTYEEDLSDIRLKDIQYSVMRGEFLANLAFNNFLRSYEGRIFKINGTDVIPTFDIRDNKKINFRMPFNDYINIINPLRGLSVNMQLGDKYFDIPKAHYFYENAFPNYSRNCINNNKLILRNDRIRNPNIRLLSSGSNPLEEFFIKFKVNNVRAGTSLAFYQARKIILKIQDNLYKTDIRNNIDNISNSNRYIFNGVNEFFMQRAIDQNSRVVRRIRNFDITFERKFKKETEKFECTVYVKTDNQSAEPLEDVFDCSDKINVNTEFYINIERADARENEEILNINDLKTGIKLEYPNF